MIHWVCFDVGETIFDETGLWSRWATYLGVEPGAFRAALSNVIAQGRHHREVFEHFRPGFDINTAMAERLAAGDDPGLRSDDIFPDVRPACAALVAAGIKIGVAGNTSVMTEHAVHALGLPVAFVASSSRFRIDKPAPGFFQTLADACSAPPADIAYVGDRIDNDAMPAEQAGMMGIWLRRGLWADVQRASPQATSVPHQIASLTELLSLLRPK
ncbi:MAG: HAD family hydrolase [Hyphomicrobiaceae bacterium]